MLTMQATIYSVSILLQKQLALEVQEIILEIFSSCFSEDGSVMELKLHILAWICLSRRENISCTLYG